MSPNALLLPLALQLPDASLIDGERDGQTARVTSLSFWHQISQAGIKLVILYGMI